VKLILSMGLGLLLMGNVTHGANGLKGSGATFPALLVNKMTERYEKETGTVVTYSPIGSFNGLAELSAGKTDFAISDVQLSDSGAANSGEYVDVPVTLGAIALVYNLEDVPVLKLTPDLLLDILAGRVTRWNDSRIQAINMKVKLPAIPIKVITRSDLSGTTFLLNRYLMSISNGSRQPKSKWRLDVPGATQVSGNQQLVDTLMRTPGAFGYTESHYAARANCGVVALRNAKDRFLLPNVESILAATEEVTLDQVRNSGINSKNEFAYPIVGFSWMSTSKDQSKRSDYESAKSLINLMWWMTHQGQLYAEENGFTPLPPIAMKFASQHLKEIRFDDVIIR